MTTAIICTAILAAMLFLLGAQRLPDARRDREGGRLPATPGSRPAGCSSRSGRTATPPSTFPS